MQLKNLLLRHFRNYQEAKLIFHPQFNLLIGKNAQGKTNLLEAIYYLGFLNSFRTSARHDLISSNQQAAHLHCDYETSKGKSTVNITIESHRRMVELNGKKPNLYKDYYGQIPILLFEPKDVYLFRETPSLRRRYINRAIFLDNPEGLRIIREYDEVVAQKNKILKDKTGSFRDQVESWNEQLVNLGSQLVSLRLSWIKKVNQVLSQEYRMISGKKEEVKIKYQCSFISNQSDPSDQSQIQQALAQAILKKIDEEFARGESVVGPHRDDWSMSIKGQDVGCLGSQGENRSGVIALKSTQVHLYEKDHGFPPLFLLDDIASELDLGRVEALFSHLQTTQGQVFLTTTEPASVAGYFKGRGASFLVEAGKACMLES